jgi:hypothetical protein
MTRFYEPDLTEDPDSPFVRDAFEQTLKKDRDEQFFRHEIVD